MAPDAKFRTEDWNLLIAISSIVIQNKMFQKLQVGPYVVFEVSVVENTFSHSKLDVGV